MSDRRAPYSLSISIFDRFGDERQWSGDIGEFLTFEDAQNCMKRVEDDARRKAEEY